MKGRTYYSEKIKGSPANHNWQARFDVTDGYVGINQYDGETLNDRVLLSPAQVRQLIKFVTEKKKSRAA